MKMNIKMKMRITWLFRTMSYKPKTTTPKDLLNATQPATELHETKKQYPKQTKKTNKKKTKFQFKKYQT